MSKPIARNHISDKIHRLTFISLFGAMAYAVMLVVHIKVSFLTLDVKDTLITLCGLYFGPLSAFTLSVLVPLLELITVSDTGWYGLVMNFLGSAAFSVPTALIYKYKKTFSGAILGLITAVFSMVCVMITANLLITPLYMSADRSVVVALIPKLLLPFNAVKAFLNAGLVLLFYKRLSQVLRRAKVLPERVSEQSATAEKKQGGDLRTLLVTVASVLIIAASLVVIFAVLKGKFAFFK